MHPTHWLISTQAGTQPRAAPPQLRGNGVVPVAQGVVEWRAAPAVGSIGSGAGVEQVNDDAKSTFARGQMQRRAPVVVPVVDEPAVLGADLASLLSLAPRHVAQEHAARDVAFYIVQLALLRLVTL